MLLQLSKTVKQSPKSPQIFENNGTFCADRPFSKNRSETNCQKSFVFNQLVSELQSYILSTTTETGIDPRYFFLSGASIVHPFNNNWNDPKHLEKLAYDGALQSYILSTTTETLQPEKFEICIESFNRTSFQQQLKRLRRYKNVVRFRASIVHPFNNNWNKKISIASPRI